MNQAGVYSQSFTSNTPHDSLLFDGNSNSFNFLKGADDKCKIKVSFVSGEATGTYWVDTVYETCGEKEQGKFQKTGQLKRGVELVPGYEVTTGGNGVGKNADLLMLDLGPSALSLGRRGKIMIDKNCVLHLKEGAVQMAGDVDISTPRSNISHKNTQYTVEVVPDGDKITDIVKVYEGSVTFSVNTSDGSFGKNIGDKGKQMQKLSEDFQSGKITAQEYSDKMKELTKDVESSAKYSVTVDAGFKSSITDTGVPTDPEAFDINADHWWENK